jgi:hypothetical protein
MLHTEMQVKDAVTTYSFRINDSRISLRSNQLCGSGELITSLRDYQHGHTGVSHAKPVQRAARNAINAPVSRPAFE